MLNKQTTLDLNGPILSFTTQPQSTQVNSLGNATLTATAVATFPSQTPSNPASNTGSISYRWYVVGFGALSDGSFRGATLSGTNTSTLTISSALDQQLNQAQFYVEADYVASAYSQPSGTPVVVGTARSTGNAVNEPIRSDIATLTVLPEIQITGNPSNSTVTIDYAFADILAQSQTANFSVTASATNGTNNLLQYQWSYNGTDLTQSPLVVAPGNNVTFSGQNSSTLSLSTNFVTENNIIRCSVSHPTATNSPQLSNTATFNVELVPSRAIINYEYVTDTGSGLLASGSRNIRGSSGVLLTGSTSDNRISSTDFPVLTGSGAAVLYAPERDINVEIDLYGCAGAGAQSFTGGRGGYTRFRMTIRKNIEYVLRLGRLSPSFTYSGGLLELGFGTGGGPTGGIQGNNYGQGGGLSVFYRQAQVLVACGGGGGAAPAQGFAGTLYLGGSGGHGGGALDAGESGRPASGSINEYVGRGGDRVTPGNLNTAGSGSFARDPSTGAFSYNDTRRPENHAGGILGSCTHGGTSYGENTYWASRGFSFCQNMGFVPLVNQNGIVIPGTTSTINRGHKFGLGHRNTGGNATATSPGINGAGGGGAVGGWGASPSTGSNPGGGGSGYTNGEATIIQSLVGQNVRPYGFAIIREVV